MFSPELKRELTMPLFLRTGAFNWILRAFVVVVFVQCAVPVEGQCLRRRRVPTLDFPTSLPMWEIYGLNPYAPVTVQPIPFSPLQVSNYAAVRAVESVEILDAGDETAEGAILKRVDSEPSLEARASKNEIDSLKRELNRVQGVAEENLKRAERAESKISKLVAESKTPSSEVQDMGSGKVGSKGRPNAKRGTAVLKQELAKIEKTTKQQETRATQKISREFKRKIEALVKTGKSGSDPAFKSLVRERAEAVAEAVKRIREKSQKRILEIQKELSARARS